MALVASVVGFARPTNEVLNARVAIDPLRPLFARIPIIALLSSSVTFIAEAVGPQYFMASAISRILVVARISVNASWSDNRAASSADLPNCDKIFIV